MTKKAAGTQTSSNASQRNRKEYLSATRFSAILSLLFSRRLRRAIFLSMNFLSSYACLFSAFFGSLRFPFAVPILAAAG